MHCILRRHALKSSLPRTLCSHRLSSTQVAVRLRPKPEHLTHQEDRRRPNSTGLFAVEHVDGRARHLTWSNSGEIAKEWREVHEGAPGADNTGLAVSTRSSVFGRMAAGLRQMFLPTNYPQSVHPSYLPYHVLQFAESIVGTLVSVLCNQALLVSVGVSAEGSIFGAVAVQWIIKDGAGEIAKLFFIRRFSTFFDSHPKTFNLIGAGCVLFGSGLQIASLIIPATATNFLLCAAGGNIFKLIGNAVWLTTHIKFVRLFSRHGNTGDVAAKSESQASVGQLLGYAAGIGLLTISHSAAYLYTIFAITVPAHMVLTGQMLRVATFEVLTLPRLSQLAREYASEPRHFVGGQSVSSLQELEAAKTTGFFGEFFKRKQDRYVRLTPRLEDTLAQRGATGRELWELCADVFERQRYLLYPDIMPMQPVSAFYAPSATTDDMLQSVLHAACLRQVLKRHFESSKSVTNHVDLDVLRSALEKSSHWTSQHFPQFKARLQASGWRTNELAFADHGRRVQWGSYVESS